MAVQCSVFCAVSLDGFIARKDGTLDWLMGSDPNASGPPPDSGYDTFISSVDYIVLGRRMAHELVENSFGRTLYRPKNAVRRKLSDHCPVFIRLRVADATATSS